MIYFIFICTTILLLISIFAFDRDLCAPAFLFVGGFWLSEFWAIFVVKHWIFKNEELSVILIGGMISFVLGCILIHFLDKVVLKKKVNNYNFKLEAINLSNIHIIIFLICELIFFVISYYVVYKNTGSSNLIIAMGKYYDANKYGRLIYDSSIIKVIQYFNFGLIYFIEYIIAVNIVLKRKNKKVNYIILFVALIISVMQGTRNMLFMGIISFVIMIFLIKSKATAWKPNIKMKTIFILLLLVIFLGILLNLSLSFTGRDTGEFSGLQMINSYLGAPIKNLDLFIGDNIHKYKNTFGLATFSQTYNKIYKITGNSIYNVPNLYTYRWIGTEGLGNVYTIFMPLYYDFGIFGTGVFSCVLGIFFQLFYSRVKYKEDTSIYNKNIIIYSYMAFSIAFSFFSNKVFETIFSISFIYILIGLYFTMFISQIYVENKTIKLRICKKRVYRRFN